ncbi:vanadium-dependent haloperoxidase [Variovorax sp. J22P168]|uniref:vanadium-dependent haloperoxidase n=1 Tax=Variovorax jilinensis TaxID=3053513 RepID=UPI002575244D|nr:vanadium-dependent haloperoxidase [Variovorax sp. J22P168]MDM0014986.1 vanadium-dependent haloperoxidase [Variovorax sp. J22P168]
MLAESSSLDRLALVEFGAITPNVDFPVHIFPEEKPMNQPKSKRALPGLLIAASAFVSGCGGGGGGNGFSGAGFAPVATTPAPVKIQVTGPNPVSQWNEVAIDTINQPAATTGTAAEQRPSDAVDLAAVHLAIYNALAAITGKYQLYGITVPVEVGADASQPAAVAAAARGVLNGLFPNRSGQYQDAYVRALASIEEGSAKSQGVEVGNVMARAILTLRADDGRSVVLAPYVPGTAPGRFRGVNPVNRFGPYIKPYALESASQFRTPPPPALDSEPYAADFNETRLLGGAVGSTRTSEQLEIARFHTEPPNRFWPRNLRRFAMTDGALVDQARLMAMLFAIEADAGIACFESKYHYETWRPQSAIPLADTDGNPATVPDTAWKPIVPTPNHPEYPAAHACVSAAVAETLKTYYRTEQVEFSFDSTVTGTTHAFASTKALVDEVRGARIYGGMHFRNSLVRGEELGINVAQWTLARNFQAR